MYSMLFLLVLFACSLLWLPQTYLFVNRPEPHMSDDSKWALEHRRAASAPCAHAVRRVARVGRVCATGAGSGRQGGPQAHAPVSPLADPASPVCMYVRARRRGGMTGGQAAPHRLTTHPQPCAQSRCARTAEMRRPPRAWGVRALTAEPRVPASVGRCPACLSLPASQAGVQRCSASAVSRSGPDRRAHAAPPHAVHAKSKQSVMILAPLTPCSQPINVAPCVQSVSSAQNNNRDSTRALLRARAVPLMVPLPPRGARPCGREGGHPPLSA